MPSSCVMTLNVRRVVKVRFHPVVALRFKQVGPQAGRRGPGQGSWQQGVLAHAAPWYCSPRPLLLACPGAAGSLRQPRWDAAVTVVSQHRSDANGCCLSCHIHIQKAKPDGAAYMTMPRNEHTMHLAVTQWQWIASWQDLALPKA